MRRFAIPAGNSPSTLSMLRAQVGDRFLGAKVRRAHNRVAHYPREVIDECLCGGRDLHRVADRDRYGLPFGLLLCRACGLGIQSPRLSESSLRRFYHRDYRLILLGGARIGEQDFARGKRRGAGISRFLEESGHPVERGLVVEIGSGSGGILAHFAELGAEALGCELDEECVAFSRTAGVPTVAGEIDELAKLGRMPDLVILSHLVEHIARPLEFMRTLHRLVSDETLIYVEVPGIRNPKVDLVRDHQVAHVYCYDRKTITWLGQQSGFEPLAANENVSSLFRRAQGPQPPIALEGNFEANLRAIEQRAELQNRPASLAAS